MRAIWLMLGWMAAGWQPQTLPKPWPPPPNPNAVWPWKGAIETDLGNGVTRWTTEMTGDGTTLELIRIDFGGTPSLRFRLYDQDHFDDVPFDNRTDYFDTNVAEVARRVRAEGKEQVVFGCNGLFHGYNRGPGTPPYGLAFHIGLNVSGGVARYNVGSPRWAWGAKIVAGRPIFSVRLSPTKKEMEEHFDEGAVGAQLLVRARKPMGLFPLPQPGDPPLKQPIPTGPNDAGAIPNIDYLRTSRISMGWTSDSKQLYFLLVNEPDSELQSKLASKGQDYADGGWTLRDVQSFWLRFGIDHSINSDAGAVAQWIVRVRDGSFDFQPPRWIAGPRRLSLPADLSGAPKGGGTLMSFLVTLPMEK